MDFYNLDFRFSIFEFRFFDYTARSVVPVFVKYFEMIHVRVSSYEYM